MQKSLKFHPTIKGIISFTKNNHKVTEESIQELHEVFWPSFLLPADWTDLTARIENRSTLSDAYGLYKKDVIGMNNEYHDKLTFIDFLLRQYEVRDGIVLQKVRKNNIKNIIQLFKSQ